MKLEIDITRQDFIEFNTYHFMKTRFIKTLIIGIGFLIFLQILLNKDRSTLNFTAIIASSILYLIIYSAIIYYELTKTGNALNKDGSILGKKSYEFTEDYISFSTIDSDGRVKYNVIKKIGQSKKAFYLYTDWHMAIIVPKRYFVDLTEKQKFHNYIQSKTNVA